MEVGIATRMRRGVEVRNRHSYKVLCENCVQGSAMVSWLVSNGLASNRARAALICLKLVNAKLVAPVGKLRHEGFRDADSALYRFLPDEAAQGGLLDTVSLKRDKLSSVDEDEEVCQQDFDWEFAPHTAHNSLALDIGLAEDLRAGVPTARLQELRRNVRRVVSREALGWTRTRVLANGAVVSRRAREPRGLFHTVRTDGIVKGVTADEFQRELVDLTKRERWEPSFADAVVVDVFGAVEPPPTTSPQCSSPSQNKNKVDWDRFGSSSARPDGMSVAVGLADDAELAARVAAHVDPDALCGRCGAKPDDLVACPACGLAACRACRARLAWDVQRDCELRICRHCYVQNPHIFHPAISTSKCRKLATWWNMADVRGELAAVEGPASEVDSFFSAGSTECPPATIETKWSKCTRCGARVNRTVEAMERHEGECVMGILLQGDEGGNDDKKSTLGGVPRRRRQGDVFPRVIYRTAILPRSGLFRPRQVCAFQDAFAEEDVVEEGVEKTVEPDGTVVATRPGARYAYEISVRHRRVTGEPNHVTVEVLLLAHAARPGPGGTTELTVVSQVDAGRNSRAPSWMVALVHGEDARCGALAAFESPAAAAARELTRTEADESTTSPNEVGLEDFELVTVLGRGGFGTVLQVRKRSDGRIFAMKVFKKAELRRRRQVERTRTERGIIQHADHPYIVKLRYAFQTAAKLYMVMDFAQGGDFFSFLRRFRRLDESWVSFYVAELGLALQHLHDMAVVYRDLKPENILMDKDGHALLADFGLSRDFSAREPLPRDLVFDNDGCPVAASRSYCGTEVFMAPEMLLQKGHTKSVDWWGLGLLAHEMLASRHPFQGASRADTIRNMVRAHPDLDADLSPNAESLVRSLLAKSAEHRLATDRGVLDLMKHPFFDNIDWDKLAERRVEAPYVPNLASNTDVSNFDAEFTNETPRDSELEKRQRANFKDGNFFLDIFTLNFRNKDGDEGLDDDDPRTSPPGDSFRGFSYYEAAPFPPQREGLSLA